MVSPNDLLENLPLLAPALAAALVLWDRLRLRRVFNRLEDMLDQALQGGFREEVFDESRLSAVEARLAQYLAASAAGSRSLEEEKETIKSLIADISHQTKTPIANVLLYAQLLGEQPLSQEGRECLAALEGQTEKLRSLIEALVKTSRLETGVITLEKKQVPVADTLTDAINGILVPLEKKQIELDVDCPEGINLLHDSRWTAEAVYNLLDNAVKYTPAGGRIQVTVHNLEMFLRIDVADTGRGIPESKQAAVFKRFYREEAVHDVEGIGIGLYLTREIITMQGGFIRLSSTVGEGSVFSVYLPKT